jgi:alkylhydroperoxidase family enzyme
MQALADGNLEAAGVTDAERALLEFTRIVNAHAYKVTDEDVEKLRRAGWSEDQISEGVYIMALFSFFNKVADAFGVPPMGYLKAGKLTP